jgi:hypothetical protein
MIINFFFLYGLVGMVEEDILEYCHEKIYKYSGTGKLSFEDGQEFDCEFVVFQMKNGEILFHAKHCRSKIQLFSSPENGRYHVNFVGLTDKNYKISGENGLITNIESINSEISVTCSFDTLDVQILENKNKREVHFGITNFEFTGNECNGKILTLDLKGSTRISIITLEAYEKIMKRIKAFKSIDVTSEVIFNLYEEKFENAIEILDDLLYVMSIARGTKIQWIYYEIRDDKENFISRVHSSRVTKVYSSYNLIDPKDTNSTKAFLENAKPVFDEKNELVKLMRELIDSHLDSLIPGIYLETKGVNLGVTMEMLKEIFIRITEKDGTNKEHILTDEKFEELKRSIRRCIKLMVKEKEKRILIYENLEAINRIPFKALILDFYKEINFEVSGDQIQFFIKCRNKLVHTGNFYCRYAAPEIKERYPQLKDELSEYLFLVNFINKLLLKSYGYRGFYLDWSYTEAPIRRELL